MDAIYHADAAQDFVGVGRIAGQDFLTRWVETWKWLFYFFTVSKLPSRFWVAQSTANHRRRTILGTQDWSMCLHQWSTPL